MVTVRVYDGDKKVFANAIPESYMYYLLDKLNKDFSDHKFDIKFINDTKNQSEIRIDIH